MQPLEIDSAVFCDGARYTIISRENSSILTCPVTSGAGVYTLNRVEGRDIDLELDRLTGHAACIAVDVPTWCRIAAWPTRWQTCSARRPRASSSNASPPPRPSSRLTRRESRCSPPGSRRPPTPTRSPGAAAPRSCAGCRARSCTAPRSPPRERRSRGRGVSPRTVPIASPQPTASSPRRSASAAPTPPRSAPSAPTCSRTGTS